MLRRRWTRNSDEKQKATWPYKSVSAVENAFCRHADLLADIATETSRSSGEIDTLETDSVNSSEEASGTGVTYSIRKSTESTCWKSGSCATLRRGKLTVAVVLGLDERYAVLNPDDADEPITFEDTGTEVLVVVV